VKPREWVNEHREELRKEFVGKTVLVCEDMVVKVFEGPVNPLKINEEARRICAWNISFRSHTALVDQGRMVVESASGSGCAEGDGVDRIVSDDTFVLHMQTHNTHHGNSEQGLHP
jgi:hypothetical protein